MKDFLSFLVLTIVDIFFMKSAYPIWEKTVFAALALLSAVMMTTAASKVR
jgi:hypothetical protein